MAKILGNNNKVLVIENKKDIGKIIKNNEKLFSEIKYNYEFKDTDCILEFQEKQLLIISDNYENILLIIENILYYLKYNFLDDNNELKPKIKTSIQEMLNSLKKFSKLKDSKLLKGMKFKIEAVNEEYLNMKRINIEKLKKNKQLELKEKNSKKEESTITNNNIKINEIKEEENSKGDILNQRLMAEIKNIKENNRVLEECLKDRQKTINELKNTLRIIGGLDSKKEEENYDDFNGKIIELENKIKLLYNFIPTFPDDKTKTLNNILDEH